MFSVFSLCRFESWGMATGCFASPRAAVAVPSGFTPCLADIGIGRGGLRFFIGSISGIVVFFHSSLLLRHGKVMCV